MIIVNMASQSLLECVSFSPLNQYMSIGDGKKFIALKISIETNKWRSMKNVERNLNKFFRRVSRRSFLINWRPRLRSQIDFSPQSEQKQKLIILSISIKPDSYQWHFWVVSFNDNNLFFTFQSINNAVMEDMWNKTKILQMISIYLSNWWEQ